MKILSLRLSNLASIAGEHSIHFEQEPLKNAGLIAITGVTGAGKTTLLDAVCLALFDQIPRLQQAENNKKLADISGEDILLHSTVNILRRGCVQGFAEVEFIAQDHKHYLARWEVKRARLKASGRIQPVLRALRCISDNQLISERTKECNERISQLLGLSFDQFTRAVLLAQSEVTAFLKAKDAERADLLEYLTNSDIYSRIGMASFAATKQAREKVEHIEKKLGDQQPLTDQQRQDLAEQLQQTQNHIAQRQAQQQQLEKEIGWYQQQAQLQQHIDQQKIQLHHAQQALTDFQPDVKLLQQLEQFEPVRECFIQQQQLQQQLIEQKQAQLTAQQQAKILTQQLQQQQQEHQQQRLAFEKLIEQHQHIKPHLQQAQQYEHQLASLKQQQEQLQQRLNQLDNLLAPQLDQRIQQQQQLEHLQTTQQQQLTTLQHSQDFAAFDTEPQAAIQTLQKAANLRQILLEQQPDIFAQPMDDRQQHLAELAQALAELCGQHDSIETLEQQQRDTRQQLEQQKDQISKCELVSYQIQIWTKIEQQRLNQQQQQHAQQQQLEKAKQQLEQATITCQQAELQFKTTQQLLQEQRLFTAQSVKELRQQLQPAHPCMVCGSTRHPFYDPKNLLDALNQQIDEQLQQAEHALQQAKQQEHDLQQQVVRLQTSLEQLSQHQQQLEQDKTTTLHEIECISSKFYQRLQGNTELSAAQQQLKDIQQKLFDGKTILEQQCQQQQNQLEQWQQLEKQFKAYQQLVEKCQELATLEQQLIDSLSPALIQQWQQQPEQAQQLFTQQIRLRCDAHKQLSQLDKQLQQCQTNKAQLDAAIEQQQSQQVDLTHQLEQQLTQQEERQQALELLFSSYAASFTVHSSQEWQNHLEQQRQDQQHLLNQTDQQKQYFEKQHIIIQQQLAHIQQQLEKTRQSLQHVERTIEQWQQQHPHFGRQHISSLLAVDFEQKRQLQTHLQQLQQQQQQAQNTLSVYEQQWQQHLNHQPEHDLPELQQQLPELKLLLNQLDEQCTALKLKKMQDEQQQKQTAHDLAELEKAKAEHHRWDKISSLIGDAKGATFKKLAQQFHLQMLVELANQQLSNLTLRYSLRCLEDSLGLTIVDHYMNDEVRPVLSLSGGESFLVSLALALGIANMASGSTKLETLFIDEGFGTLDQDSLHIVMDALDRLQSQGRKVILISHISEMHERIPAKIQVIPQGSGASLIEVVG
ncbi:AAA family ATPase [Alkanindiges sp. WGS2144]|uniref:AAA family ATPase n=1 Tax=Alkanindiges sp. WGS2144 TaxID=3366808 RepID=UPI00375168EB